MAILRIWMKALFPVPCLVAACSGIVPACQAQTAPSPTKDNPTGETPEARANQETRADQPGIGASATGSPDAAARNTDVIDADYDSDSDAAQPILPPIHLLPVAFDLPDPLWNEIGPDRPAPPVWAGENRRLRAAGPTWRHLAGLGGNLNLASGHGFASLGGTNLMIQSDLNNSDSLNTGLKLTHESGPLSMRFDITGNKTLLHVTPMELSYDSSVMYTYAKVLTLGVIAKGALGTLSDFAPPTDHIAGPVAKLHLWGLGTDLSAETDYLFTLRPGATETPQTFRMKLNLNLKFGG